MSLTLRKKHRKICALGNGTENYSIHDLTCYAGNNQRLEKCVQSALLYIN